MKTATTASLLALASLLVCSSLAFNNPVATETVLDGEVRDIIWTGNNAQYVLVITSKGTLYRSNDEGKSWYSQMNNMPNYQKKAPNGKSGVAAMIQSPADPGVIFFMGYGTNHWLTKTYGASYSAVTTPVNIDLGYTSIDADYEPSSLVDFHPTESKWLLAAGASSGCTKYPPSDCFRVALRSKDDGEHWTIVSRYVTSFAWAAPFAKHTKVDPDTFFTVEWDSAHQSGSQKASFSPDMRLVRNHGTNSDVELESVVGIVMADPYYIASKYKDSADADFVLMTTKDEGETWTEAKLPPNIDLPAHSFSVINVSYDAIFLFVNHFTYGWGNVYVSNVEGTDFAMVLDYVVTDGYSIDFTRVNSIEGVWVANIVENPYQSNPDKLQQATVISHDNGGEWRRLKAPATDASGAPIACTYPACSVQVAGAVEESLFSPVAAPENAVGLVMGSGFADKYLVNDPGNAMTFLSTDGGLTWTVALDGPNSYAFGDHGGILLAANNYDDTNKVQFSWNEGSSWREFQFTITKMGVASIASDPAAKGDTFVVVGSREVAHEEVGVLVTLDFSGSQPRLCDNDDYVNWSPSDSDTNGEYDDCLLGRQTTYERRKPSAECYNGRDYERSTFTRNCVCTEQDLECDYGYYRETNENESPCIPLPDTKPPSKDPPKNCKSGQFYSVTNGYRLVAGDSCNIKGSGLEKKLPTEHMCDDDGKGKKNKSDAGNIVAIFVLLILSVCVIGAVYYKRDEVRQFMTTSGVFEYSPLNNNPATAGLDSSSDEEYGPGAEVIDDDAIAGLDADDDFDIAATAPSSGSINTITAKPAGAAAAPSLIDIGASGDGGSAAAAANNGAGAGDDEESSSSGIVPEAATSAPALVPVLSPPPAGGASTSSPTAGGGDLLSGDAGGDEQSEEDDAAEGDSLL